MMTIVPSTASGSGRRTAANGRNASTASPANAPDHLVRGPDIRSIELRENDPPHGMPPTAAAARLGTPWLTSSGSALQRRRSSEAKRRAMDAASVNPMSAITAPGSSSSGSRPHGSSSSVNGRKPPGMSPTTAAG